MSTRPRIYMGNIPYTATDAQIREFFDGFKVTDIKIIMDRETNRPRGFAFVEVESAAEQKRAIETLHNQEMGGRRIMVSEAKERERAGTNGDRREYARRG